MPFLSMSYLPSPGAVVTRWFDFGGGKVTFEGAGFMGDVVLDGFGEDVVLEGEATDVETVLLAGTTGDVCFTAPPIATGLFLAPPTALCARAGLAKAQRAMAEINTPLFIRDSFQAALMAGNWRRTSVKIRFVRLASTAHSI
jgi:hypothetical protein